MKQVALFALHFFVVCLLLVVPLDVRAGGEEEKAVDFFKQGRFGDALGLWYSMTNDGSHTAGLYYNIGLAESQLKHTAEAMLAFEQAQRLAPGDEDVKSAIVDERKKIENATIPVDSFFLSSWYKSLVMCFRPGMWALIGLGCLGIGLFLLFRKDDVLLYRWHLRSRMWMYITAFGVAFIMLGFLSYKELYRDDEAIVFERCAVHQAPADASPEVRTLGPGEKIVITDAIGEWYNVQMLNLDQGWIKANSIKPILAGRK
jgi:tetratricopeptide (TPR) repeat protein